MSRAMTPAEVKAAVLTHVASIVDYWEREERAPELRDKLEGVAFSILTMLDGSAATLPAFLVMTAPHPDDTEFAKSRGENYFPDRLDIGGDLHEDVGAYFRKAAK
jgi:hypothetical protein